MRKRKAIICYFEESQWAILKAQAEYECRAPGNIIKSATMQYIAAQKVVLRDSVYCKFVPQIPKFR